MMMRRILDMESEKCFGTLVLPVSSRRMDRAREVLATSLSQRFLPVTLVSSDTKFNYIPSLAIGY